jgi:hypothetical protein
MLRTLRLQVRISQKMTENIELCATLRYVYALFAWLAAS